MNYKNIKTFEQRYNQLHPGRIINSSDIQKMLWAEIEELRAYFEVKLNKVKEVI